MSANGRVHSRAPDAAQRASGALLIRGPSLRGWVPALRSSVNNAATTSGIRICHVLKKLFAASFDARCLVMAAWLRSLSEVISAMRSVNSSTDSSDRSCPISWVTFFLGLSSSSIAMCSPVAKPHNIDRRPDLAFLPCCVTLRKFLVDQVLADQVLDQVPGD